MTNGIKIALCFIAVSAAGCGASQAVGSRPGDMTPERHCAAAAQERVRAGHERNAAERVAPTKATVENRVRAEHKLGAEKHELYAAQHEQAALTASGGNVPPCGPIQSSSY